MKTTKLENINACADAVEWVKTQKSAKDAWMNCERGDWMLWIAKKLNVDDRKLTLAKAKCVEPVRHLMKDQISLDALDACYKYANGEISREELNSFAAASYAAASNASYAAASYAAYAAVHAAYAAVHAATNAYAAVHAATNASYAAVHAAVAAVHAANDAVRGESLKKSADICREVLTDIVLHKYKRIKL